jgi:hypothetical protein
VWCQGKFCSSESSSCNVFHVRSKLMGEVILLKYCFESGSRHTPCSIGVTNCGLYSVLSLEA